MSTDKANLPVYQTFGTAPVPAQVQAPSPVSVPSPAPVPSPVPVPSPAPTPAPLEQEIEVSGVDLMTLPSQQREPVYVIKHGENYRGSTTTSGSSEAVYQYVTVGENVDLDSVTRPNTQLGEAPQNNPFYQYVMVNDNSEVDTLGHVYSQTAAAASDTGGNTVYRYITTDENSASTATRPVVQQGQGGDSNIVYRYVAVDNSRVGNIQKAEQTQQPALEGSDLPYHRQDANREEGEVVYQYVTVSESGQLVNLSSYSDVPETTSAANNNVYQYVSEVEANKTNSVSDAGNSGPQEVGVSDNTVYEYVTVGGTTYLIPVMANTTETSESNQGELVNQNQGRCAAAGVSNNHQSQNAGQETLYLSSQGNVLYLDTAKSRPTPNDATDNRNCSVPPRAGYKLSADRNGKTAAELDSGKGSCLNPTSSSEQSGLSASRVICKQYTQQGSEYTHSILARPQKRKFSSGSGSEPERKCVKVPTSMKVVTTSGSVQARDEKKRGMAESGVESLVAGLCSLSSNKTDSKSTVPVYFRCSYCSHFTVLLNQSNMAIIVNHTIPATGEELQTSMCGNLGVYYSRGMQFKVQLVKQSIYKIGYGELDLTNQRCEVILTHYLSCKKCEAKFPVENIDENVLFMLSTHIEECCKNNRRNSFTCLFCSVPFTKDDYMFHVKSMLPLYAFVLCYAGAYCIDSFDCAKHMCHCGEREFPDVRFILCGKHGKFYDKQWRCRSHLQSVLNGFMKTSSKTSCSCVYQQGKCSMCNVVGEQCCMIPWENQMLSLCAKCKKSTFNAALHEKKFHRDLQSFQMKRVLEELGCLNTMIESSKMLTGNQVAVYDIHQVRDCLKHQVSIRTPESSSVSGEGCNSKALYMCKFCNFTADLTPLLSPKNADFYGSLIAGVVLRHILPEKSSLLAKLMTSKWSKLQLCKMNFVAEKCSGSGDEIILVHLETSVICLSCKLEIPLLESSDASLVKIEKHHLEKCPATQALAECPVDLECVPVSSKPRAKFSTKQELEEFCKQNREDFVPFSMFGCNLRLASFYESCILCNTFTCLDLRHCFRSLCDSCLRKVYVCLTNEWKLLTIQGLKCVCCRILKADGYIVQGLEGLSHGTWVCRECAEIVKEKVNISDPGDYRMLLENQLSEHLMQSVCSFNRDGTLGSNNSCFMLGGE